MHDRVVPFLIDSERLRDRVARVRADDEASVRRWLAQSRDQVGRTALVFAVVIGGVVLTTTWPGAGDFAWARTSDVATALFGQFVLPFEIVSVLLTAAVVGGVLLARRELPGEKEGRQ